MKTTTPQTAGAMPAKITGIRSVTCYTASPVETCDCCSAGIKYVSLVTYRDSSHARFGMTCIERVLSGDTSLVSLFRKNEKLLRKYLSIREILSRPSEALPVDERGYFDRGLFFIAGNDGKSLSFDGRSYFHPLRVDWDKFNSLPATHSRTLDCRPWGSAYAPMTADNWRRNCEHSIAKAMPKLDAEITRIESFLARVVSKGLAHAR